MTESSARACERVYMQNIDDKGHGGNLEGFGAQQRLDLHCRREQDVLQRRARQAKLL